MGVGKAEGAAGEIDRDDSHRGEVIGALIVEQIESAIPPEIFKARCDLVYEHGTRAIANSMSHTNLFLMPLWRALGRATWVLRARTLPKTVGIVTLLVTIILGLVFIKKDFNLEAEGTLVPMERREIFAPIDGEVLDVLVDHDDPVERGELLVRMINRDLEIQLTEVVGQISTNRVEERRVQGQLRLRNLELSERRALEAEQIKLETEYQVLRKKEQLFERRMSDLQVRSPIKGRIVSWDVQKTLRSRPIVTGQVLLEVADLNAPLVLEVELPEKREGHLDRYIKDQGLADSDKLEVSYILATDPDVPLDAKLALESVSMRADADEEHGAIIKMRAIPSQDELRDLKPRPGAKVIAKIYCGRRSSGFVFFHEIYEWCCKFFF